MSAFLSYERSFFYIRMYESATSIRAIARKGHRFLRAMSNGETPAISDIAIITIAIGDAALPRPAESCTGIIILMAAISKFAANSGTKPLIEVNDATPLPVIREDAKVKTVISIMTKIEFSPSSCTREAIISISPKFISPSAKTAAQTIRTMTDVKVLPMPIQKGVKEAKVCLRDLLLMR